MSLELSKINTEENCWIAFYLKILKTSKGQD